MEQKSIDTRKMRALVSLQYGVELDETSLTILTILIQEQSKQFAFQNQLLEAATEKISRSKKSLQASPQSPRFQAFWFGMGKWGFALIYMMTLSWLFIIGYQHRQEGSSRVSVQLEWYKQYYDKSQKESRKAITEFLKNNPPPENQ